MATEQQLTRAKDEFQTLKETRSAPAQAARKLLEVQALERRLQREQQWAVAVERDPEYPAKLQAARQAFGDAERAERAVDAAEHERSRRALYGDNPDPRVLRTLWGRAPLAVLREDASPNLLLTRQNVRQLRAELRALEAWPARLWAAEQRSAEKQRTDARLAAQREASGNAREIAEARRRRYPGESKRNRFGLSI